MHFTQNPIGSDDQLDLQDNAISFDYAMNSPAALWQDRFGKQHKTVQQALKDVGFKPAGFDFVSGGTLGIGDRDKCVFYPTDGYWYSWNGKLPYVVTADGSPTPGGKKGWSPLIKDDRTIAREALRRTYQDVGLNLVNGSFEVGGTLKSSSDALLHEATGKVYVWSGVFPKVIVAGSGVAGFDDVSGAFNSVGSIKNLLAVDIKNINFGSKINVTSYHQTGVFDIWSTSVGGGVFVWTDVDKSLHDGGVIIDPERVYPSTWESGVELDVEEWFFGTSNDGRGCWVRQNNSDLTVGQYGARGNYSDDLGAGVDDTLSFNAALKARTVYNEQNFSNNSPLKRTVTIEATKGSYLIGGACYIRKGQELRGGGLGPVRVYIKSPAVKNREYDTFRLGVGLIKNPFPSNPVLYAAGGYTYITLKGDIRNGQYNWLGQGHFLRIGSSWHVVRGVEFTGGNTVIEVMSPLLSDIQPGTFISESELNDSGGLPPSISNICTEGGHVGSSVINGQYAAGMTINTLFITSAPLGIYAAGGDVNVHSVTFDMNGVGMAISGSRNSITGCHFFWNNIGLACYGDFFKSYDWVVSNCTFAFNKFQDISVDLGSYGKLLGFKVTGCNFLENAQESTKSGMVHVISGEPELTFTGCTFSNMRSWAVVQSSGVAKVKLVGCEFRGLKSNSDYIQSVSSSCIAFRTGRLDVNGCIFSNIHKDIIRISHGSPLLEISVKNNVVTSCTSTQPFVFFEENPLLGKVVIKNNDLMSGKTALIGGNLDHSGASVTHLSNNSFVQYSTESERLVARVSLVIGKPFRLEVSANGNPLASVSYVRSDIIEGVTGTVYDGAMVNKIAVASTGLDLGGSIPPQIDLRVGFNVSGDKTTPHSDNKIYTLFVSVPGDYGSFSVSL